MIRKSLMMNYLTQTICHWKFWEIDRKPDLQHLKPLSKNTASNFYQKTSNLANQWTHSWVSNSTKRQLQFRKSLLWFTGSFSVYTKFSGNVLNWEKKESPTIQGAGTSQSAIGFSKQNNILLFLLPCVPFFFPLFLTSS